MTGTRARILSHALEILASDDAATFTMRGVAEDLGLSSGSVFHAFPSRKALTASAFAEGIGRYHDVAVKAIEEFDDPVASLRSFVARHLEWVEANAGLARFLFTSQPEDVAAEASELVSPTNTRFRAVQSRLFDALTETGAMGDVDGRLAHSLAIGPAQEYCRKWLRGVATSSPSKLTSTFQASAVAALAATMPAWRPTPAADAVGTTSEPSTPGVLSYQGVVYPWHCDHMGHMNVMWYTSKFDEATWHFLGGLGLTPSRLRTERRGMSAIDQHTKYLVELQAGDLVEIRTRLLEQHSKVLIFEHEMVESVSRQVAATSRLTGIHLDTEARRSQSLPEDVKQAAAALLG